MPGTGVFDSLVVGASNLGETLDAFRVGQNMAKALFVNAPWYPAAFGVNDAASINGQITFAAQTHISPFVVGRNNTIKAMACVVDVAGGNPNTGVLSIFQAPDGSFDPTRAICLAGTFAAKVNLASAQNTVLTSNLDQPVSLEPGVAFAAITDTAAATTFKPQGWNNANLAPQFGFFAPNGTKLSDLNGGLTAVALGVGFGPIGPVTGAGVGWPAIWIQML